MRCRSGGPRKAVAAAQPRLQPTLGAAATAHARARLGQWRSLRLSHANPPHALDDAASFFAEAVVDFPTGAVQVATGDRPAAAAAPPVPVAPPFEVHSPENAPPQATAALRAILPYLTDQTALLSPKRVELYGDYAIDGPAIVRNQKGVFIATVLPTGRLHIMCKDKEAMRDVTDAACQASGSYARQRPRGGGAGRPGAKVSSGALCCVLGGAFVELDGDVYLSPGAAAHSQVRGIESWGHWWSSHGCCRSLQQWLLCSFFV